MLKLNYFVSSGEDYLMFADYGSAANRGYADFIFRAALSDALAVIDIISFIGEGGGCRRGGGRARSAGS